MVRAQEKTVEGNSGSSGERSVSVWRKSGERMGVTCKRHRQRVWQIGDSQGERGRAGTCRMVMPME